MKRPLRRFICAFIALTGSAETIHYSTLASRIIEKRLIAAYLAYLDEVLDKEMAR